MPTVHTMAAGGGEKGHASGGANGLPGSPEAHTSPPFPGVRYAHWQEAAGEGSTLTDQVRADNAFPVFFCLLTKTMAIISANSLMN